ncbi:TIGR04282 family arsenosugar biosynthesis glycosyltransferase [Phormidium sp. LEGE 05292]|uniref:TIGR04282 family arsenosugar biosynthesis glycosyltransferase n=1 Tax=[Phormidium] sp. LEGE 05292 TaxID=767427 RepID=UPI00187F5231|nr:TIGR04282 family arsenosugar biosynthesis glycosyltransferase [Phormidium sp. LEGE 05292]MBE9223991.1 TIGR04282 family arsenosugar biosynthesis glycosyltransferase [Phormidium sp. LEGE 05292]
MTNNNPKNCLITFTRYPEPGKTKTRLIPVLGAEGAANLHRQLTETVITQVKEVQNVLIEVHFTGGNQQLMQAWLGENITYRQQSEGNLGRRMATAFQTAFNNGIEKVVIIGSDCPMLNYQIIEEAFAALSQHELVLGRAADGGYYLIGLKRLIPELFTGVNWGTSEVLQQTVKIAENLKLAVAYLSTLSDIDRPEDLAILDFKPQMDANERR